MTGGRAPRRKGDVFERAVVAVLLEAGFAAERCFGAGRPDDVGDVELAAFPWLFVDCKNAHRFELAEWVDALAGKAARADDGIPLVVVKRPRRPARDAYAVVPLWAFAEILERLEA